MIQRSELEFATFLAGRGSYLFRGWDPGIVSVVELCTFLGIDSPTEPAPISAAQLAALKAEFPGIFEAAAADGGTPQ